MHGSLGQCLGPLLVMALFRYVLHTTQESYCSLPGPALLIARFHWPCPDNAIVSYVPTAPTAQL